VSQPTDMELRRAIVHAIGQRDAFERIAVHAFGKRTEAQRRGGVDGDSAVVALDGVIAYAEGSVARLEELLAQWADMLEALEHDEALPDWDDEFRKLLEYNEENEL